MGGARRLGRYIVGERLGSGGLGEVYLAHAEGARGFRKQVVIKQVRRELAPRAEVARLLLAEAEVVQRLAHGNIVQVIDVGVEDEAPYLVMEFVDGVALAELLADLRRRGERLGAAGGLFVVESVCAALEHAHARGLVHRDVTPANILVSRDGVVKLTDFGIAAVAGIGANVGTPGYAAPEQLRGAVVDARADVYALGVVLAELLGDTDAELRALAVRASASAPADRVPSAGALAAELERWRAGRGVLREASELADRVQALQARRGRVAVGVEAALEQRQRPVVTAMMPTSRPRRVGPIGLAVAAVLVGAVAWAAWSRVETEEVVVPEEEVVRAEPEPEQAAVVAEPQPVAAVEASPEPATSPGRSPAPAKKERAGGQGRLQVNLVPWAEVRVDGRSLGRTPIDVGLAPGRYTLEFFNPDLGQRKRRPITVARGGEAVKITEW